MPPIKFRTCCYVIKKSRFTNVEFHDGHNSDSESLRNRSGKNAQTFFREFVQRTKDDHAAGKHMEKLIIPA